MDQNQMLQKISWGVLLFVIAVAVISIGILGLPFAFVIPVVLLVMGLWIFAAGGSNYHRAWGTILAVAGGLWLSYWLFLLPGYMVTGIFLAVVGFLVILGSLIPEKKKTTGESADAVTPGEGENEK